MVEDDGVGRQMLVQDDARRELSFELRDHVVL
jgi:hypothetical protein